MRLLRLSNSDDLNTRVPPEFRAGNIIKALLEHDLREPVDVETRLLWPGEKCPGLVEGWVREFEPDMVYLRMGSYWITWESVPRMVAGRFGGLGDQIASVGKKSARTPWLAENPLYRGFRHLAVLTVGGETPFTVDGALAVLDETYRRIVAAQEDVALVVRAPNSPLNSSGTKAGARRSAKRHAAFEAGAKGLAKKYRADWMPMPAQLMKHGDPAYFVGDGIHKNEAGHRDMAIAEAKAITETWRRLRA
ncbi:MAG: SGNH/GDSL hydrolase family protein [Dehalococcoidia bacterium]